MEKPFKDGETLREGTYLDIEAELRLVRDINKELEASDSLGTHKAQRKTMKELGLKRYNLQMMV